MTSGHDDFGAAPGGEDDLAMDEGFADEADEAAGDDGPGAWSAGQAGAEADPYAIEELGETYGFAPDDVLATWAREHAESTGMPPEQFKGLVSGYVEMMADQLSASLEAELGELELEWGAGARDRLEELTEWARGLTRGEEEFVAVQRWPRPPPAFASSPGCKSAEDILLEDRRAWRRATTNPVSTSRSGR